MSIYINAKKICKVFSDLVCIGELLNKMEAEVRYKRGFLLASTARSIYSCVL